MLDALQIALGVDHSIAYADRRVAHTQSIHLPQHLGPAFRPLLQQPGLAADSVSLRPTPLGPILLRGNREVSKSEHNNYGRNGFHMDDLSNRKWGGAW